MSRREIIRPATSADIPLLSALFSEVFGTSRDDAVWRWKYFENPRGCATFVCVAGGRAVAHCGGTPVRVREGELGHPAFQSVDFMSSPNYPGGIGGGGVFVRTVNAFFATYCGADAVPLVYGFPGERHRRLGERLLGYRATDEIVEFTLPSRGEGKHPRALLAADLKRFDIRWGPISASRDETYLAWRYLGNPAHRYGIVSGESASAIVRIAEEAVYVMELGGEISSRSLVRLGAELARFGRPAVFWGSRAHPIGALLEGSGFHAKPRGHHLECRYFTEHRIPAAGEFYFTLGDYDVY